MLVDANVLLYAVDATSAQHETARAWLERELNGVRRVGLPWQSLGAFLRIATHPRASADPLSAEQAWSFVEDWIGAPAAWVPTPGPRHAELLGELMRRHAIRGNLVPDAQLAALAIEHGVPVVSADGDFARFSELRWENPFRG